MGNHRRPAVKLYQPEPPRQALAKEKIVAVMQDRLRQQLTLRGLPSPHQIY
jgi:hypothetical protein